MISMKSALEANNSQQDLVVSRSKLRKVFRSEGPRHTPVQQGLILRAFAYERVAWSVRSTNANNQAPGTTFSNISDEVRPEEGHDNFYLVSLYLGPTICSL